MPNAHASGFLWDLEGDPRAARLPVSDDAWHVAAPGPSSRPTTRRSPVGRPPSATTWAIRLHLDVQVDDIEAGTPESGYELGIEAVDGHADPPVRHGVN